MASRFHQGKFTPKNPKKIIGDPTNITYRSSWEKKTFIKLDESSSVVRWGSECVVIPYVSPKDGRVHRYFPDLLIIAKGKNGFITTMIEIKPMKQSVPPASRGKNKERYLNEVLTYAINQAKWNAAEAYCESKGIIFKVMTESDIFPK